jgi:hypothetical protein
MAFDRIMVWKFDAAPARLQRLHDSSVSPEWMVLIPRRIYHADIDKAIIENGNAVAISRYETEENDVIYVGDAPVQQIPALVLRDNLRGE